MRRAVERHLEDPLAEARLKGTVVDALLRGRPWPLTFDDMLTARSRDAAEATLKQELAATLMGYARANPDTIRGRPMPVIVYDPSAGARVVCGQVAAKSSLVSLGVPLSSMTVTSWRASGPLFVTT